MKEYEAYKELQRDYNKLYNLYMNQELEITDNEEIIKDLKASNKRQADDLWDTEIKLIEAKNTIKQLIEKIKLLESENAMLKNKNN